MISTKGRYALRVLIDLCENGAGKSYIPLKEIAARQEISQKYLERILPLLTKAGYIDGIHGKGGGYRLIADPEKCTVWEVLTAVEGDLAPVACLECTAPACTRAPDCRTLPLWKEYYRRTKDYFDSVTLSDLAKPQRSDNFVI